MSIAEYIDAMSMALRQWEQQPAQQQPEPIDGQLAVTIPIDPAIKCRRPQQVIRLDAWLAIVTTASGTVMSGFSKGAAGGPMASAIAGR